MKRIIFIGLYLMSCICLVAQTAKTYTLTFDENDFSFIQSEIGDEIISNTQSLCYDDDTSLPEIPYLEVNILLPENNICNSFSYRINDSVTIEREITLKANPGVIPMSQLSSYTPANRGEYPLTYYPFNIEIFKESYLCGYRYVALKVSPFSYNAKEKVLKYASNIDLTIELEESYLPHPTKTFYSKETIELTLKDIVINPEEFYIPQHRETREISSRSNLNAPIKYLIITCDSLKNAFQELANWKTTKGVKAKIETVEDIYNTYTDSSSNQIKIKQCIYDYYQQGLEYVLLGGDENIVPIQGCFGKGKEAGKQDTTKDFHIPTDLFYSLFDGNFDWNADGDSIIGEIEDNVSFDFKSVVAISRIPISTPQEIEIVIHKTINYELNPSTTGYNKMLLVGNKISYYEENGQSDAEIKSKKMYSSNVERYSPNMIRYDFFDTNTSHNDGASYELNSTNLQSILAEGFHHIHVMTHGLPNLWIMENNDDPYTTNHALSLCNNNAESILLTTACYSNAFDKSYPCLSEAFLKNSQSGVVAFWGSSRQGWGYNNSETIKIDPSLSFSHRFYKALFYKKNNRLGKNIVYVKSQSNETIDYIRWLLFSLNAIGDPELPIYTDTPKSIKGVSWVHKDNKLYVAIDSTGYTMTLTSKNDNGNSYYQTVTDSCNYVFQNVDSLENYQLCITKDNYIPLLITNLKSNVIIQNQTFTNTSKITGIDIVIGSNVSKAVEEGPVIIESGSTTFDATNSVTIKNGFECKKGATLEIK